ERFRLEYRGAERHDVEYARAYRRGKLVHALESFVAEPKLPRLAHLRNVSRILRTSLRPGGARARETRRGREESGGGREAPARGAVAAAPADHRRARAPGGGQGLAERVAGRGRARAARSPLQAARARLGQGAPLPRGAERGGRGGA